MGCGNCIPVTGSLSLGPPYGRVSKEVLNALEPEKPIWIVVSCRYRQYDIGNNRIRCNHYLRRPPNVYLLGVEWERTSLYGRGLKVSRMLWEHDIK